MHTGLCAFILKTFELIRVTLDGEHLTSKVVAALNIVGS